MLSDLEKLNKQIPWWDHWVTRFLTVNSISFVLLVLAGERCSLFTHGLKGALVLWLLWSMFNILVWWQYPSAARKAVQKEKEKRRAVKRDVKIFEYLTGQKIDASVIDSVTYTVAIKWMSHAVECSVSELYDIARTRHTFAKFWLVGMQYKGRRAMAGEESAEHVVYGIGYLDQKDAFWRIENNFLVDKRNVEIPLHKMGWEIRDLATFINQNYTAKEAALDPIADFGIPVIRESRQGGRSAKGSSNNKLINRYAV